jgi:hypothetical protein
MSLRSLAIAALLAVAPAARGQIYIDTPTPKGRPAPGPAKLDEYSERPVGGFRVFIHKAVFAHRDDAEFDVKPMDVLVGQFRDLVKAMPAEALTELRPTVRVWVEWDRVDPEGGPDAVAVYRGGSPEAIGLKGVLPAKANGIEIISLRRIALTKQPEFDNPVCVLLHEMAHAWHHQVIGPDNEAIRSAYKQAMDRHAYLSVRDIIGRPAKAYATTNEYEYFAELSEAYLLRNDYFPFSRDQLKLFDPVGHRLVHDAWAGVRSARALGKNALIVRGDDAPEPPPAVRQPPRPTASDEAKAARKLDTAKQFLAMNKGDRAKALLEDILRTHPGTPSAREAKVLADAVRSWKTK